MKTSLDAGDSKESNGRAKNIPLTLKFLIKIHICAFAVLISWQFSDKIQKHVPRTSFSLSNPVFALRRSLVSSEISDLLLFVSNFASQNNETKFAIAFLICVV